MFERFTDEARQAVARAQEGARRLGHDAIGTEHLLLGLLADPVWDSTTVLASLGVDRSYVNDQIIRISGRGTGELSASAPYTSRAKQVLELSLNEALRLGHSWIGTEHVLLALTRDPESMAMAILLETQHDGDAVRAAVTRWLESRDHQSSPRIVAEAPRSDGGARASVETPRGGDAAPPRSDVAARARVSSSASFSVLPDPPLRLTLMRAAARALEDGRESYGLADLLAVVDPDALPRPGRP